MSVVPEKHHIVYERFGDVEVATLGFMGLHDVRIPESDTAHLVVKVAPTNDDQGRQPYRVSIQRTAFGELPTAIPTVNGDLTAEATVTEGKAPWVDSRPNGPEMTFIYAGEFDSATQAVAIVAGAAFGLLHQRRSN